MVEYWAMISGRVCPRSTVSRWIRRIRRMSGGASWGLLLFVDCVFCFGVGVFIMVEWFLLREFTKEHDGQSKGK